jgi:hypothetical protein
MSSSIASEGVTRRKSRPRIADDVGAARNLAVVALSAIQLPIIKSNLPVILAAIDNAAPGSFQVVECGAFSRKKPDAE